MCEQTEINYMEGDVVWVKIGTCWWPSQVTNFENLPEDMQKEFKKKPLIAAVKFFQEDAYEVVKNFQQIYKYNCTQKEEFIKKGLDKYRTKSRNSLNYMDKFPGDVEMAEKLTGGDPDILSNEKFCPEEKPDIAALFGEKKIPKRKRDDFDRRATLGGGETPRKITHPRFLRESDHEVRIRHQPSSSLSGTPKMSDVSMYTCPLCKFTSTRVNVIICHYRSHRSGGWESPYSRTLEDAKSRHSIGSNSVAPKRKYVRKNKSMSSVKTHITESVKRKHTKVVEKLSKKKKSDPELKEQLLADWDDEFDDEAMDTTADKSDSHPSPTKNQEQSPSPDEKEANDHENDEKHDIDDDSNLIKESDQLLKDTEQLTEELTKPNNKSTLLSTSKPKKSTTTRLSTEIATESLNVDDNDKKSKLSCFDFDEEEPEPTITPVRKIPRVFGEKNTSLKKEIIKEFTMNQALNEKKLETKLDTQINQTTPDDEVENDKCNAEKQNDMDQKLCDEINATVSEANSLVAKIASETASIDKSKLEATEELEIVEIFQVESEKNDDLDKNLEENSSKQVDEQLEELPKDNNKSSTPSQPDEIIESEKVVAESPEMDTDRVTIEEEDDTLSISQLAHSASGSGGIIGSVESPLTQMGWSQLSEIIGSATPMHSVETPQVKQEPPRRRGRPRKVQPTIADNNGDAALKLDESLPGTPDSQQDRDRKTSESDTDRSYTGRRRKPNKKYLDDVGIYSPGHKTDDSQSETEEKIPLKHKRGKRGQKPVKINKKSSDTGSKSIDDLEMSDQTLDSAEECTSFPLPDVKSTIKFLESKNSNIMSPVHITDDLLASSDIEIRGNQSSSETIVMKDGEMVTKTLEVETARYVEEKAEANEEEDVKKLETPTTTKLPPKKSQIKKFELSQIDILEDNSQTTSSTVQENVETNIVNMEIDIEKNSDAIVVAVDSQEPENIVQVISMEEPTISVDVNETVVEETVENVLVEEVVDEAKVSELGATESVVIEQNKTIIPPPSPAVAATETTVTATEVVPDLSPIVTDKVIEEPIATEKKEEAIEVALEPERLEKKIELKPTIADFSNDFVEKIEKPIEEVTPRKTEEIIEKIIPSTVPEQPEKSTITVPDVIQEIVCEKTEIIEEIIDQQPPAEDINIVAAEKNVVPTDNPVVEPKKSSDSSISTQSLSTTSQPTEETMIPVKKREKPRIIENVQLKEPMQILKTKLLEKQPIKIGKHKLDYDGSKKGVSKTKMMKIDSNKISKASSSNLSLTQKLQVLKAEQAAMEIRNEKIIATPPSTLSLTGGEKFTQSSQSLEDMDLDINSIPFVLSEDLNPDSIEQMPVMISSIIPASAAAAITNTLTLTTNSPIISTLPSVSVKSSVPTVPETITLEASPKKKSSSPAILKPTKSKAKPTITSIRTLNPPLTGGVKGLKFQHATKAAPMTQQKSSPGKFVIVQTTGAQPLRYPPTTQQKVPIIANKSPGNAQIQFQQGKVVILTPTSSGQTKMLPLKGGTKLQKIVGNKGQLYSQLTTKGTTTIAPKNDNLSATTSKQHVQGQKILTTKGIMTPISTAKTGPMVTLSSGVMKDCVFTPVRSATIAGKSMIGPKTALVANKTAIVSQITGQGGTKALLASISSTSLPGKALVTTQTLASGKGTVLTPITGQQVKAIAANTPGKPGKIQYQQIQQKIELPSLQKCQKIPISSSSATTMRIPGAIKTPGGTIVFPNAQQQQQQKTTPTTKKIARQHSLVSNAPRSPSTQTSSPQTSPQRSKSFVTTTSTPQKLSPVRSRTVKGQQKMMMHKMQDTATPGLTPIKSSTATTSTAAKMPQKTSPGKLTKIQSPVKNTYQKLQTPVVKATDLISATGLVTSDIELPATPEKIIEQPKPVAKEDTIKADVQPQQQQQQPEAVVEAQKVEETKVTQPQIMALPTESSDGSQTYVLVTIDEQGQIQPLDNNTLMSLEGTTQNPDGSRTLYIDPSSLGDAAGLDNLVLQFDNGALPNLQANTSESSLDQSQSIIPTSNQDILAAALANTDFHQEIGLPEASTVSSTSSTTTTTAIASSATSVGAGSSNVMTAGLTQTSLINQTILQSTIIPTSDPISSPSVLETSLTLNQPIMSPLEVPSNLPIQTHIVSPALASTSTAIATTSASLELPITITNPNLSYITSEIRSEATVDTLTIPGNSMPDIGEILQVAETCEITRSEIAATSTTPTTFSTGSKNILDSSPVQTAPPSMPIIDDSFVENVEFTATSETKSNTPNVSGFVDISMSELLVAKSRDKESKDEKQEFVSQPSLASTSVKNITDEIVETEVIHGEETIIQTTKSDAEEIKNVEKTNVPHEVEPMQVDDSNVEIISSCIQMVHEDNNDVQESSETIPHAHSSIFDINNQPASKSDDSGVGMYTSESIEKAESSSRPATITQTMEISFDETAETTQEAPSQSYEEFSEIPTQSKAENSSREPTQSLSSYESMEIDETGIVESGEPPTQSFDDVKTSSEASQSYETSENNTNAPTQSFNELIQEEQRSEEAMDDPNFPTQSYEVGKFENMSENIETDGELSQEGNIPSQSNDITCEGIGTSSFNNTGLNEDETASSSYVPETPETQERDQDQESAISTSSYEIPTCEEINIASSSINPDTSVGDSEHIHDNGVPEIPTSSYNLNADSSSGQVDAVPSSSYEDQVVIEQNVSTSYDAPISIPELEENSSQNFVSESTDHDDKPTSYYAHHSEEITSEASQSYFAPEGPSQTASPRYYEPPPETEASQSFYSQEDVVEQRSEEEQSTNVEASQSFYQETSDELRLRQQGEATPTYTERYPADYIIENSPIDRHDLVESSVSTATTQPTEER